MPFTNKKKRAQNKLAYNLNKKEITQRARDKYNTLPLQVIPMNSLGGLAKGKGRFHRSTIMPTKLNVKLT